MSPQARAVARAVLPAYLVAAVLTLALWRAGLPGLLPATWMALHGVAILATSHHATPRLVALGVSFLVLGCAFAIAEPFVEVDPDFAMAAGFGVLHLAYGAVALARPVADD